MSLIAYAYDTPEGIENRLNFWLSMDEWEIAEATQIIADIDPDQSITSGTQGNLFFKSVRLFNGHQMPECDHEGFPICTCHDDECGHCECEKEELLAYSRKCKDISRLLNNKRSENLTFASPKVWIARALCKKIEIPWIKWAKKRSLLPDGLAENAETSETRRERIRARVLEEKAKGTKAFLRVVAEEEEISTTRIKQIVKADAPPENNSPKNSPWLGMLPKTKQTSSMKSRTKC